MDDIIWTKDDLRRSYDDIVRRGLSEEQYEAFRTSGHFGPDVVTQVTSGSSGGVPLLIPRSREDLADAYRRVLRAYQTAHHGAPARVALFGGVSHAQAAVRFTVEGTTFRSFGLDDLGGLIDFDPEFISCYPSIARELVGGSLPLHKVKAFKLGGERVFDADVDSIVERWPGCLVIEQYGSTEMPAMAMGTYLEHGRVGLVLQVDRYDFLLDPNVVDWQPLIVRDKLKGRLFPIEKAYDTGDEVQVWGNMLLNVRRRDDPANDYADSVEVLLRAGCENVQFDLRNRTVRYSGRQELPSTVLVNGTSFAARREPLRRLAGSNKLPLVL
ncbi:hypothetical protein LZC95_08130 [Pendulispora brunnea]|uniref:Uncharacterized protein n=1 Tax=Pendulispora brunnea TaxID=2905690 RepID=A0ABZ2KHL0_9BACT